MNYDNNYDINEANNIRRFKTQFNKIRQMGYVKSINNYDSGIGLTFEMLLGKKIDNFPFPDFNNTIEIKTKLAFSKRPIHLFNLSPDGSEFVESKRILEKYGYFRKECQEHKMFHGKVYSNKKEKIGLQYSFSLDVNYKEEKVILQVYNEDNKLIDNTSFWTFKKIEIALMRKIKILALIQVWPTQKNGIKYYKYYKYNLYKNTNIFNFINLLDKGIINISFSITASIQNNIIKAIHDHGTSFDIQKDDLDKLFFNIS